MECITQSVAETEQCGAALAKTLTETERPSAEKAIFVALYGDLGAGKTAFVRGFVRVLSPDSRVKSPTYTIVNEYRRGRIPVFHFDLYRIASENDLDSIGFDEYVQSGICIAEWCEHIGTALPENAICVHIEKLTSMEMPDTGKRKITIEERHTNADPCH